ncbi:zinc ribbon domain-containing protein [Natrialbaceae archaeon GCM10025810]|uniref:double zinc ribbon domain-containing protein n=1 Tax=Halovalidus salilacus TaxID=3075124 RepID=UPI003610D824
MSKITFRADDDLVDRLESIEASKSEVMRDALRAYFESTGDGRRSATDAITQAEPSRTTGASDLEELVRDCVDVRLEERRRTERRDPSSIDVTISLDGLANTVKEAASGVQSSDGRDELSDTATESVPSDRSRCGQCGEAVESGHVYCPNCGEKASRRLFCDCGDELRSDWSFCPSCGRRTPAADVLDR